MEVLKIVEQITWKFTKNALQLALLSRASRIILADFELIQTRAAVSSSGFLPRPPGDTA